ncbi:beta-lactamase family protein [Mucilaginibacter sp. RS28]|uniref:Beta-lactamase family protein n=1 Tax=Mucilaginibacter straminoryzae TaxID=2932774 RepID=A0A9X1X5W2_9SPHI|nr:serine hydrolase domain-containing protein [Mucilaginibacter straminoryzae]MCJ8211702.1 beta-lactamase family protein [Mucilaginibacter straminoryzae]
MKKLLYLLLLSIGSLPIQAQPKKLQSFINGYVAKHQFDGTILIQENGKVSYHKSYGLVNREFALPATNDTRYKICSITKSFTAVLILQLYDAGKIDLNAKMKTYLPNYKGEAGDKVSIHQLLNHTSGMSNTDTIKSFENAIKYGVSFYQKPYTTDQLLDNFASYPLVNNPGEKFDYNNGDYIILGKILEGIYKKPYEEILNERLLKPLGMANSGMLSQAKLVKRLANTYMMRKDVGHLVPDLPVYMENWYAAGGMYSTTADLLKFWNAVYDLKLISKRALDLMLTPGLGEYGYSVWISDSKGKNNKYKRMERFGSIMGANDIVVRYLNKDLTIIILSNTNLTDLGDFAYSIGKEIF